VGGNGVLLILRQAGNLLQSFLQEPAHDTNLPNVSPFRNAP
jgi:hypothetical protein